MKTTRNLGETFLRLHPAEAAGLLESLAPERIADLCHEVAPAAAAGVFERMSLVAAAGALGRAEAGAGAAIVAALPLDAAARILRAIEPEARARLRAKLPEAVARALDRLLRFPEGTAGTLMDPLALGLPVDLTVAQGLDVVRANAHAVRYYVYVVTREDRRLIGVVSLRRLLERPPEAPLEEAMDRSVESLSALSGRDAILAHPAWRRFHSLPVVDGAGTLLGAVRYETFRTLETEASGAEGPSAVTTAIELGELFWIGFGGLLSGIASGATGGRR